MTIGEKMTRKFERYICYEDDSSLASMSVSRNSLNESALFIRKDNKWKPEETHNYKNNIYTVAY